MTISTTYKDYLSRQYIMEELKAGRFNADDFYNDLVSLFEASDYSVPQFNPDSNQITRLSNSSVTSLKGTFGMIQQDLQVLFNEMLLLGQAAIEDSERWKVESELLDRRLNNLLDRIENLLLLSRVTDGGYHTVLTDNFDNAFFLDPSYTTVELDPNSGQVQIPQDNISIRHFLTSLNPSKDLRFKVYNNQNFLGRADSVGSTLLDPFLQDTRAWWTTIYTNAPKPVACELWVHLGNEPINLNKLVIDIHASIAGSPVHITPLLSIDNHTYTQLAVSNPTISTRDTATFHFPVTEARWMKLLLVKDGPDTSDPPPNFSYHFGFKQISLFQQSFDEAIQIGAYPLISHPRYGLGSDGLAKDFKKCTLEVCETTPDDTRINYFVAVSDDPTVPVDGDTRWIPISPNNRISTTEPQVITLGDFNEILLGDDENLSISYNSDATGVGRSPSNTFQLVSIVDDEPLIEEMTAGETTGSLRYQLLGPNDGVLNHQLKVDPTTDPSGSGEGFDLDLDDILLFRNTGLQGLDSQVLSSYVRGIQKGWGFNDPWFTTVIQITNPNGMSLDLGRGSIVIDGQSYSGKVGPGILSGRTSTRDGIHSVWVHKDHWLAVPSGLDTLTELKAVDPLYPYNQKLLIEGYLYGNVPVAEQLYQGVDVFAERLMKKISIFDFNQNASDANFSIYADDLDAPGTHDDGNLPTRVFLVKFDSNAADFQNERFLLRLTRHDVLYKYLRLRADLITEATDLSPVLTGYKIKLG